MRLSLVTRVPFRELVDMPPELLATVMLAHHDLHAPDAERLPDVDD